MKFIKAIIILVITINLVTSTEDTKFRKKSLKIKSFLKKKGDGNTSTIDQYSNLAKSTNILDMVPDQDSSVVDLKLSPGPVHYSGWIKFFKYNSNESQVSKPSTFFKNLEFYQQSRKFPKAVLSEKIEGQNKYIKDESFFYLLVFYDSMNILTSSLQKFKHTYDTLNIDLITPQVEEKNFIGGITDFGSFSEGFCLKVNSSSKILTVLPKGDVALKTWIFCTETAVF